MANETQRRLQGIVEFVLKDQGLLDLKKRVEDAEKGLVKAESRMQKFGESTNIASKAAKGLAAELAPYLAFAAMTRFLYQATTGQEEMARATRALETRVRALGLPVEEVMGSIEEFIGNLQAASGVTDDELVPAFSKMLGLTGSVAGAMAALEMAVGVSKSGMDTFSGAVDGVAAILAGRANEALKSWGINQKDAAGRTKTNEQVVRELLAAIDGQAKAAADAEGPANRLSAAWDRFGDTIGTGLIPMVNAGRSLLSGLLDYATRAAVWIETVGIRLALTPEVIKAQLTRNQRRMEELVFIEANLIAAAKSKYQQAEQEKTKTAEEESAAREALFAAARRKDQEARDKEIADAKKVADAKLKAMASLQATQWGYDRENVESARKAAMERAAIEIEASAEAMKSRMEQQRDADQFEWDSYDDLLRAKLDAAENFLREQEAIELEMEDRKFAEQLTRAAILNANTEALEQAHQARVNAIKNKYDKIDKERTEAQKARSLSAVGALFGALSALFPKFKAFAIAEAVINSAVAITTIWRDETLPTWAKWVAIAAAAISCAAAIQRIRGTNVALAAGAVVTGPTNALIGEAGPEVVMPARGPKAQPFLEGIGRGLAETGAGGVTIHVNGWIVGANRYDVAETLYRDYILPAARRDRGRNIR